MTQRPVRRVVTGHDAQGSAIIHEDGTVPRVVAVGGEGGPVFHEVWNTRATPAPIDAASGEPHEKGIVLAPPRNGSRIRVVDFPPETGPAEYASDDERRARFAEIGAADAVVTGVAAARHPHMHRTETIDYGIVLEGELVLIMDEGETTVRAGDIVVQRGTNHAWANRSGHPCRICFVLIDGTFDENLRS